MSPKGCLRASKMRPRSLQNSVQIWTWTPLNARWHPKRPQRHPPKPDLDPKSSKNHQNLNKTCVVLFGKVRQTYLQKYGGIAPCICLAHLLQSNGVKDSLWLFLQRLVPKTALSSHRPRDQSLQKDFFQRFCFQRF